MILLSMFSKLVPSSSEQQCSSLYIGMPCFIAFSFLCFIDTAFKKIEGKTFYHKMTATHFIVILALSQ